DLESEAVGEGRFDKLGRPFREPPRNHRARRTRQRLDPRRTTRGGRLGIARPIERPCSARPSPPVFSTGQPNAAPRPAPAAPPSWGPQPGSVFSTTAGVRADPPLWGPSWEPVEKTGSASAIRSMLRRD